MQEMLITSQSQLKNINRVYVLNYVRRNQNSTKAELAQATGLSVMTIQKIVEELEELNLLREDSYQSGGVGRRAVVYTIDENYAYTIGLHINVFTTTAGIMNFKGDILHKEEFTTSDLVDSPTAITQALVGLLNRTIENSGIAKENIIGIGVGAPGPLDSNEGTFWAPPNFKSLHYLPLKKILEEQIKLPVHLHKDTNVMAMAEYWHGKGLNKNQLFYIDADLGIGSGLVLDGMIYSGANSIAGEFGHITINPNGPRCNCGNYGCLEAMASGISIVRDCKEKLENLPEHTLYSRRETLQINEVIEYANHGDPLFVSVLNDAANYMGIAVAGLINVFDPDLIVFGGILMREYAPYFSIVKNTVLSRQLQGVRSNPMIPSVTGDEVGIIGAGETVVNYFFAQLNDSVFEKEEKEES